VKSSESVAGGRTRRPDERRAHGAMFGEWRTADVAPVRFAYSEPEVVVDLAIGADDKGWPLSALHGMPEQVDWGQATLRRTVERRAGTAMALGDEWETGVTWRRCLGV
jgi:hypothetical protein